LFEFAISGGRAPQPARPLAASVIGHGVACLLLFVPLVSPHIPSPAVAERHLTLLAPGLEKPVLPVKVRMPRPELNRPFPLFPPVPPHPDVIKVAMIAAPEIETRKPVLPEIPRSPVTPAALMSSGFDEHRPAAAPSISKPTIKTSGFQSAETSDAGPARLLPSGSLPSLDATGFDTVSGAGSVPARNAITRSGGFSDVSASSSSAGRQGSITSGSFGDTTVDKGVRQALLKPTGVAALTPVEILSKPKPAYTEEARVKKVEGEVLLEMQFSASGEARVLRLVRGLGYGLNETALAAAQGIRFRPATRDGGAVDSAAIVHIVFQLAN
jgi:TonB family protein